MYGSVHSLSQELRTFAIERGPNSKMPTVSELCRLFGTSTATLNTALKDLEEKNVISRRQGSGIFVSSKLYCKNIRVLINASFIDQMGVSPFWGILWGKVVKEGQSRAAYRNEEVQVQLVAADHSQMNPLPLEIMRGIETGHIHGVLSIGMTDLAADPGIDPSIPLVTFGGYGYWNVQIRHDQVLGEAVGRLAGLGCTRIGYWGNRELDYESPDAFCGWHQEDEELFRTALTANGLEYFPNLHRLGIIAASELEGDRQECARRANTGSYQDQGYEAAMRTFAGPRSEWPDGLVIGNDMMTSGAMGALPKLGILPGKDIKIASHANLGSPLLYGFERDLILWKIDPGEIVSAMFALLDRLMAGEQPQEQTVIITQRFPE